MGVIGGNWGNWRHPATNAPKANPPQHTVIIGVCATKWRKETPAKCFTEGNWGGRSKRFIILEDIKHHPGSGDMTKPKRAVPRTTPFLEFYARAVCAD